MSTTLVRSPLTDLLLLTLTQNLADVPIGDMVIPVGAGWTGPSPDAPGSQFIPYVVLIGLTASKSGGPLGDSQADWQVAYMLESFGASRKQCEVMADEARTSLDTLRKTKVQLGASLYKVQQVRTNSIGAVNRVAVTNPPFFGEQDGMSLWLSKELS